ncbi:MAG TPA: MFS transporter [Nitrososphaerales archaeon]|nr:MFS transporter [Nitrososphaerales archaeon]
MSVERRGLLGMSRALLADRNIRVLAVTGLISGVYIGMLNGVMQLFPASLGFGVAALGILQSVGNRFSGVAGSISQPIAGHLSDIYGRKVIIVVGSITTILSMALFIVAALSVNWACLLAAFFMFGVSVLGSPSSQAMVAESVGLDPSKMNVAFSVVFLLSSIPGVVTPFLAGVIAGTYGYVVIFLSAALLESVDLFLYVKELYETRSVSKPRENVVPNRFSLRQSFRIPRGSWGYFSALAMDAFTFGITTTIIYAMIQAKFGYSDAQIGIMVSVLSLATILSQYPATKLLLVLGGRRTIALSEALGTLLMAGWAVAGSFPAFLMLSVVFGASVSTWVPGVQSLVMTNSPEHERGGIGGKVAAVRGLVAFPAPILGGFLYQGLGYEAPILASAVGTAITVMLLLKYVPERSDDVLVEAKV